MTAESIRQIAVQRLQEKIVEGQAKMRQLRYRPPSIVGGATLPGNSAEEIGMVASELNAEIAALGSAVDIINEVYKMITSPTTPEAEESKGKQQEKFYG